MSNLFQKEQEYFFATYNRTPIEIERGEGVYLIDKNGRRYLDLFAGLGVNALGYGHRGLQEALLKQAARYIHLSNRFIADSQVDLAQRLVSCSGYKKIFLTNSGTEAAEGTIKLARKWGKPKNKTNLLAFSGSFHGRSMGALSLTEQAKYRDGYEPFLPETGFVRFNDVDDLCKKIDGRTLAVFIEFIQGESGINVATPSFVEALFALREQHGFLVVADEIQSGLGRTGKFFSFEYYSVRPDVVLVAKALGGGIPIGAILGSELVADVFTVGVHGSTFGGNPVACAAACAVLDEIVDGGLMQNVQVVGSYFRSELEGLKTEFPSLIREIRGRGLMLGMELGRSCSEVVEKMFELNILVNCTHTTVIRFLPPLILSRPYVDEAIDALRKVLKTVT
ncbi:MAG: aspartate aminotransferase family protein [Bacteroidota bacterium]